MRSFGALLILAFAVGLLLAFAAVAARAQDCEYGSYGCGHAENHDQYRTWKQQDYTDKDGVPHGGLSCCEPQECRPVRAKQLESGAWVWWNGSQWSDPVPASAMLPTDILHDGRSHACGPKPEYTGGRQITYCFSPAQVKM